MYLRPSMDRPTQIAIWLLVASFLWLAIPWRSWSAAEAKRSREFDKQRLSVEFVWVEANKLYQRAMHDQSYTPTKEALDDHQLDTLRNRRGYIANASSRKESGFPWMYAGLHERMHQQYFAKHWQEEVLRQVAMRGAADRSMVESNLQFHMMDEYARVRNKYAVPLITGEQTMAAFLFLCRLYVLFFPWAAIIMLLCVFSRNHDRRLAMAALMCGGRELVTAILFWPFGLAFFEPEASLRSRIHDLAISRRREELGDKESAWHDPSIHDYEKEIELAFLSKGEAILAFWHDIWHREEGQKAWCPLSRQWNYAFYLSVVATVFVLTGRSGAYAAEGDKDHRPTLTGVQLIGDGLGQGGQPVLHVFFYFHDGRETFGVFDVMGKEHVVELSNVMHITKARRFYSEVGLFLDHNVERGRVLSFGATGFLSTKVDNGTLALPWYVTRTPQGVTGAFTPNARLLWQLGKSKLKAGLGAMAFFSEGSRPSISLGPLVTVSLSKAVEFRARVIRQLEAPHGNPIVRLDLLVSH